jgi:hypothetical protein
MSINQPYNQYSEQPCRTRCSTFNVSIVKLKIHLRLESAHVQPEASDTFTQHRANPASTSRSEGLRPDYTHSVFFAHHHPTARLLGIPRGQNPLAIRGSRSNARHHLVTGRGVDPQIRPAYDDTADSLTPRTRGPRPPRRPRPGGNEGRGRKGRKEEGHPFPPGEWGGIRGVSGVPSRKQFYQPGKGGPRPSGQG